jgi:hypothetical protein
MKINISQTFCGHLDNPAERDKNSLRSFFEAFVLIEIYLIEKLASVYTIDINCWGKFILGIFELKSVLYEEKSFHSQIFDVGKYENSKN